MREQDFIPARPRLRDRLLFVSAELRAAAAAGASAAALAVFAFVVAVMPPIHAASVLAAAEGLNAAGALA